MKKSGKQTSVDFDDFLREEGILEEVRAGALKKVATYRMAAARQSLPIYLNDEAQAFVQSIARKKSKDVSTVVNELLLHDKKLVEAAQ